MSKSILFAFYFLLLFNEFMAMKVRMPSIFGRRMNGVDSNLRTAFEGSHVVPDVIDIIPPSKLQVRYANGVEIDLGNEATPLSTKSEPSVEWPTQVGQYYTLMMVDPDALSRNKSKRDVVNHWLVINIPEHNITSGETLAPYKGPTPSKRSGLHRYVFLAYKQDKLISHSENLVNSTSLGQDRAHFNVRLFAKSHKLGDPMSANFFVSRYDDYVGLLRAKNKVRRTDPEPEQLSPSNSLISSTTVENKSRISTKRAQLLDWAPRKPKAPKFPQMICLSYERYEQIQKLLESTKQ